MKELLLDVCQGLVWFAYSFHVNVSNISIGSFCYVLCMWCQSTDFDQNLRLVVIDCVSVLASPLLAANFTFGLFVAVIMLI